MMVVVEKVNLHISLSAVAHEHCKEIPHGFDVNYNMMAALGCIRNEVYRVQQKEKE